MEKPPAQETQASPSALRTATTQPGEPPQGGADDWRDRGGWRHPYALYIFGTAALFLFLVLMAYLALSNDWIPTR